MSILKRKVGRLTESLKDKTVKFRVDEETLKILDKLVENTGAENRSEVIRKLIQDAGKPLLEESDESPIGYKLGQMFIVDVPNGKEVDIGKIGSYVEDGDIFYFKIKEKRDDNKYLAELIGINMYFTETEISS